MNWLRALVVSQGWVVSNRYGMRLMTGVSVHHWGGVRCGGVVPRTCVSCGVNGGSITVGVCRAISYSPT